MPYVDSIIGKIFCKIVVLFGAALLRTSGGHEKGLLRAALSGSTILPIAFDL